MAAILRDPVVAVVVVVAVCTRPRAMPLAIFLFFPMSMGLRLAGTEFETEL